MANTKAEFRQNLISLSEIIEATQGLSNRFQEDYFDLKFDLAQTADSGDGLDDRVETLEIEVSVLEIKVTNLEGEVQTLQIDVSNLDVRVSQNEINISNHVGSPSEHGVTGKNVGTEDFCSDAIGGVALLSKLVNDAVDSTATISTPDASNAPAAYDQAQIQEIVDLANEAKAQHNQAIADLNAAIVQVNDIIAQLKIAKQMDTA